MIITLCLRMSEDRQDEMIIHFTGLRFTNNVKNSNACLGSLYFPLMRIDMRNRLREDISRRVTALAEEWCRNNLPNAELAAADLAYEFQLVWSVYEEGHEED